MSDGALIRAADSPQVAWKNGGGVTREIARFPAGAGLDDFAWRLSAARVDVPGAFSHFARVDRTIAILSGRLRLEVAGRAPVTLAPACAAYHFAGDVAAFGSPEGGPVLDLNLMVRRDAGVGVIRAFDAGVIDEVDAGAILVARRDLVLRIGARTVAIRAHDAFRFDARGEGVTVSAPVKIASVRPPAGSS
ncbi:HutD family protein [Sphingomonas sp. NFR15]|uniref:HutD/Ves family protein n=1 Tax=Sphingomonas sp. NFR15 TaxID=1566282 RepID=UPI0008869AB1|nr:HutD family protein [Sphingomonas sp. NFR15]SDA24420.1 hypothetical protein SAMN03159340_01719 [Sphingomonas sp. NFR15]